mmetsp:Transcript_793/g.1416  ORF Transcript_793/g.1416 Transcript_793/m.1416 type:complete len:87 (+) Transcript_793:375-635(+)
MKELEAIDQFKQHIDMDKAVDNYQKNDFLNGSSEGMMSGKQILEQKLLQLKVENQKKEKEVELSTQLHTNNLIDLQYVIMMKEIEL